jgi:hypothetical protein
MSSVLTPLQLIAGEGLLQNTGLSINADLIAAINTYENLPFLNPLLETISGSANILSAGTVAALNTMAANTCPALADNVPAGYPTLLPSVSTPGLTGIINNQANIDFCGGSISKFAQAINIAVGYNTTTNEFVNSAVNSQTYLADTFTGTNNAITGDITSLSLDTPNLSKDLLNLGQLINLNDLENLGSPLSLVQRLFQLSGSIPSLQLIFVEQGVPEEIVLNLTNPAISVTDSVQKLIYEAMTRITGSELQQILSVLGVITPGIQTMADLLNPVKLFPNSFTTLTTVISSGSANIYLDSAGTVNSNLSTELPSYVLNSTV